MFGRLRFGLYIRGFHSVHLPHLRVTGYGYRYVRLLGDVFYLWVLVHFRTYCISITNIVSLDRGEGGGGGWRSYICEMAPMAFVGGKFYYRKIMYM